MMPRRVACGSGSGSARHGNVGVYVQDSADPASVQMRILDTLQLLVLTDATAIVSKMGIDVLSV